MRSLATAAGQPAAQLAAAEGQAGRRLTAPYKQTRSVKIRLILLADSSVGSSRRTGRSEAHCALQADMECEQRV